MMCRQRGHIAASSGPRQGASVSERGSSCAGPRNEEGPAGVFHVARLQLWGWRGWLFFGLWIRGVGLERRGFHVPSHPRIAGVRVSDPPTRQFTPQLAAVDSSAQGPDPGAVSQSLLSPETPSSAASSWKSFILLWFQACPIPPGPGGLERGTGPHCPLCKVGVAAAFLFSLWGGLGSTCLRVCVSPLYPAGLGQVLPTRPALGHALQQPTGCPCRWGWRFLLRPQWAFR